MNNRKNELERAIIGSILISRNNYFENERELGSYLFSDPICSQAFELSQAAYSKGDICDMHLIANSIDNCNYSDLRLMVDDCRPSNLKEYIVSLNQVNEEIAFQNVLLESLNKEGDSVEEKISFLENKLRPILLKDESIADLHVSKQVRNNIDALYNAVETKGMSGIDTGIPQLNDITGGLQATDLIILAARPGMGKTTLAINIALNAAKKGHKVLVFSLEMSTKQILDLIASIETNIDTTRIRNGNISPSQLTELESEFNKLIDLPLFIVDNKIKLSQIIQTARIAKRKYGIEMIIIDYLQLIDSGIKNDSMTNKVGHISRSLKVLAGSSDCNTCNLVLSQLSRAVESRADKRPLLSDLRDSGAIEQDADMVQFLYREEYYTDGENSNAELIISKYRHGKSGVNIPLKMNHRKFTEAQGYFQNTKAPF